ncbi:MAG: hypothetical protein N2449_07895 [Bacteroidales bacterium]|nr:hypothetical protein [Bacteroidales bacterium]
MKIDTNEAFVFVVCGKNEHIQTLNFSIHALKKFSTKEIIVVTDLKRNENQINHHNIIHIDTPHELNHHEASIWIKTSLHRILPKGKLYAYLDSDVIALNSNCDKIFQFYKPPITFALDHKTISYFSPYAINCNCLNLYLHEKQTFEQAVSNALFKYNFPADYTNVFYRKLLKYTHLLYSKPSYLLKFITVLPFSYFRPQQLTENIAIDIKNKTWIIDEHFKYPILALYHKEIQKQGYRFSWIKRKWYDTHNRRYIRENKCNHLKDQLMKDFGLDIPENFHHWNGGVFLFDEQSHVFLDQWYNNTMKIFSNPIWKTRDQGTLIATMFQLKLEKHPTLPEAFNFIADFYKPHIYPHPHLSNYFIDGNKQINPSFIHVYHQFGNQNWDVWQRILQIIEFST